MKYLVIVEVKSTKSTKTAVMLDCVFKGTINDCGEYIRSHKLMNPEIIPEDEY